MIKEIAAYYDVASPRKKGEINSIIGDFAEKEAILLYLDTLKYRDEMDFYDFSRSRRAKFGNDSLLDEYSQHYLPYDYYIVRDTVFDGSRESVCWKVEVKTKMFNMKNYHFHIDLNKWLSYVEQAESEGFIFLFVNLDDGIIRYADINHKLWRTNEEGASINTFMLPNLGEEFAIRPKKLQEIREKVARKLGYKQQPLPGFGYEEGL